MEADIQILAQLIEAMKDSYVKLESSFINKDAEEFKKIKVEILLLQKKVSDMLK